MTGAWLVPLVSAAVFGSVHCIGMCGGLIAVASEGVEPRWQRMRVQSVYQLARLGSYVVLGAIAGGLGRALDLAGKAAGVGQSAAVIAGVTMMIAGLLAMLRALGVSWRLPRLQFLPALMGRALGGLQERPRWLRAALLGGASGLLPCGFLYAFALAAAASGSPARGALVMAALWLGNLPALLGFGLLLSTVTGRLKRHLPFLSAAGVMALGVYTLHARINLPALALQQMDVTSASAPHPANCPHHAKAQR